MEKVRPWCGQPSDRGRLQIKTEQLTPQRVIYLTQARVMKTVIMMQMMKTTAAPTMIMIISTKHNIITIIINKHLILNIN